MLMAGGCLCGAVRFEASDVHSVACCHCSMCRRWAGGPMFAVEPRAVRFTGAAPAVYRSSDWAERGFCRTCGSNLFYRYLETGDYFVNPFALDDLPELEFRLQVFIDEKPAFYDFANQTTKKTGAELVADYTRAREGTQGPAH